MTQQRLSNLYLKIEKLWCVFPPQYFLNVLILTSLKIIGLCWYIFLNIVLILFYQKKKTCCKPVFKCLFLPLEMVGFAPFSPFKLLFRDAWKENVGLICFLADAEIEAEQSLIRSESSSKFQGNCLFLPISFFS